MDEGRVRRIKVDIEPINEPKPIQAAEPGPDPEPDPEPGPDPATNGFVPFVGTGHSLK